jgi:hypothetical protein
MSSSSPPSSAVRALPSSAFTLPAEAVFLQARKPLETLETLLSETLQPYKPSKPY